jgi:glycyl-tRNA synthetase
MYNIIILLRMKDLKQETIVNFLKTYGFVFPNSEIYGGLANA